jgi:hypothetical protein
MNNLDIYNAVREVPKEAQKEIKGGRMNGKTDINPMWRIKALTEQFGACGIGWKYIITGERLEPGANGEISAFVDINLFIKVDGQWSDAIPGTGGSSFVAKEKGGLYTSDECFKMALTDAISVSCKALGVGADIYWQGDKTKYEPLKCENPICSVCGKEIKDTRLKDGTVHRADDICVNTIKSYGKQMCFKCAIEANKCKAG